MEKFGAKVQANILCISIATTGKDHRKDKITSVATCDLNYSPIMIDMIQPKPEDIITLKHFLEDDTGKVFYDAKKALHFFHAAGLEINGPIYDVILMDKIMRAGSREKNVTVDRIITEYLGTAITIDSSSIPIIKEVLILPKLYEAILCHLTDNNLLDTAVLEFECIRAVAGMEMNGIRVNGEKLMDMLHEFTEGKIIFAEMLHKQLGDINLNSYKKVKEAFIKQGTMINDLRQETLHPLIFPNLFLWDYSSYKKISYKRSLANTILTRVNTSTGRIYPKYSQIGAVNGRFSCSDPNLHAMPRTEEFRSCFIPDNGYKLIIADYSQIELRIVAEISRDQLMVDTYRKGDDLHKLTASLITGNSMNYVSKDECSIAEAVNYGLIYNMEAEKLVEFALDYYGISILPQQAQKYSRIFFSAYEGISRWHENVEFNSYGETRTLGNRRRIWNDYYKNTTELLRTIIQGTTADILKRALCILHERIKSAEMKIIACIHREIIMEAPIMQTDTATQIIRESMIDAGRHYLKEVPVEVNVSAVDNWYEKQG